jgi:cyclopropane fatty-acyl-phospholipid synthase-like methyltransferase
MEALEPWSRDYFEDMFAQPDPWKYHTSNYERVKYQRQLEIIKDRNPDPKRILEIGCAEGAQTLLLAKQFPKAKITAVEISSNAFKRAEVNIRPLAERIELVNADIAECQNLLRDEYYDVIVWSESIYYLGGRLTFTAIYDLSSKILGKLKTTGVLVMANTVNLPEDLPEFTVTKRPFIDCYHNILSSLMHSVSRSTYVEEKAGSKYEYQIWTFRKNRFDVCSL